MLFLAFLVLCLACRRSVVGVEDSSEYRIWKTYNGYEMAPSVRLDHFKENPPYEERFYPTAKWVSTAYNCTGKHACAWEVFERLFRYISGANSKEWKIPMTVPVLIEYGDNAGDSWKGRAFEMSFYIPQMLQAAPPEPKDPLVRIQQRPGTTVFVKKYTWYSTDRIFADERRELEYILQKANKTFGDPSYFAGYDAPFHVFNRRNEIWLTSDSK